MFCFSFLYFYVFKYKCVFPVYFVIIIGLVILFCFLILVAYFLKQEKKKWRGVGWVVRWGVSEESGEGKRMIRIYFMKKFNKNKLVRPGGDGTRL